MKKEGLKRKAIVMDHDGMQRSIARMTHEIIEKNDGVLNIVLLGVKTRGVPLAAMLQKNIELFTGVDVPVGSLDITLHRDDISEEQKKITEADIVIPCSLIGKTVILVDDVLFTGRTARAAIEAVFSKGRPDKLQLAVLVDRGHRELPIRADYVGKNLPTSHTEAVEVCFAPVDGEDGVYICEKESA